MEEESNLAAELFAVGHLPDGAGCQHEVVIMDPDQWNLIRISR